MTKKIVTENEHGEKVVKEDFSLTVTLKANYLNWKAGQKLEVTHELKKELKLKKLI